MEVEIRKGLEGVVVDETEISKVMPDSNSLVYRGYRVQELSENCSFEEVAYLLWHNDLPDSQQLKQFQKEERAKRAISKELVQMILSLDPKAHYMDTLRTAISFIGSNDTRTWNASRKVNLDKAMSLLAKIPTIVAYDYRRKNNLELIPPNENMGFSENFFHMCFGKIPSKEEVKAFDVSMVLYAEHSFNASTFTNRVITSTMSDLYSAIVGGVGALKGPLHGGANEQVMYMLKEIGSSEKAEEWVMTALKEKKKIMGFGHRVYRKGDSRVPTMVKYLNKLAEQKNQTLWVEVANAVKDVMLREKNIHPNVDFPSGPTYFIMGFEIEMFTPLFVMSRVTGWSAHIMEQVENNRIIRPLSHYKGQPQRDILPIDKRVH